MNCEDPTSVGRPPIYQSPDHRPSQHHTNFFDFHHGHGEIDPTDGGNGNGIGYQPSSFIIVGGGGGIAVGLVVEFFVSAFFVASASVEFIVVVVVVANIKSATEPCITTICRV